MSKVMLINPPGKCLIRTDGSIAERKHCTPPLGLAYLAAACERYGHEVAILDLLAEGYDQERIDGHFVVYGLTAEQAIERIRAFNPDLLGFSLLFSHLASECFKLIEAVRAAFPRIPIVLGGHHPSAMPVRMLEHPAIDYVLVGEADVSLPILVEVLAGKTRIDHVPGLFCLNGTTLIQQPVYKGKDYAYYTRSNGPNPNEISDLPHPAWHLLDLRRYWATDVRMGGGSVMREKCMVMVGSRGCPHACTFCTSPLMGGYRGYRQRTVADICAEIRWLKDIYGVDEIQFLDDNFFVNPQRVKQLLRSLAFAFPGMVFSVPAGAEANALDDDMLDLMAQAGFYRVVLAVESGNPTIQAGQIDKKVDLDRVPALVRKAREVGLEVRGYFMIGFPGESRESILATAEYAQSLDLDDFALSVVTPLPGTPLYDQCVAEGLLVDGFDPSRIRYSVGNIKLPDMTPEEVEAVRVKVWQEHKRRKPRQDAYRAFRSVEEFSDSGFKIKEA